MNYRLKSVLIVSILLTCMVGLRNSYRATAQRGLFAANVTQAQARIVVTTTDLRPPIKIINVKAKGREIETDKQFQDDDDWLRGLTVHLTNQSGKTVTFVGINLNFVRIGDQPDGLPAAWPLRKGIDPFGPEGLNHGPQVEPVLPGDEIEIVLSDLEYQEIRGYLADIQFPKAIKRVELEVIKVGFSDGTAWNTHKIYKRDPKNLKGPLKGWTPVEADGTKPEVKKSSGSARNGTALFFAHSFDRDIEVSWKVKTDWLKPLTQTIECGQAVTRADSRGLPFLFRDDQTPGTCANRMVGIQVTKYTNSDRSAPLAQKLLASSSYLIHTGLQPGASRLE